MESIQFIELNSFSVVTLFLVGFVGGMVSGFIGSGGAFVLTPAMMSFGVPGVVAVASNMAHKFPKALVGAYKRNKYGQVDIKLGLVMGVFAEAGVLFGKHAMVAIRDAYGAAGTNLYVSFVFVVVLGVVGSFVLRDGLREMRGQGSSKGPVQLSPVVRWVRRVHIPGTMFHFRSIDAEVSFLFIAPLGFATGLLAATIAVGGFIGVPAMIYILGVPALMASATELVVAFVMGLGGSLLYALDGFVDIRLSMIILAGSLFGVQIGAIGTTYVKDYFVKLVMALIMLIVMVSRFFYLPGYLSDLGSIDPLSAGSLLLLNGIGQAALAFALVFGAVMILRAQITGMREHRLVLAAAAVSGTDVTPPDTSAATTGLQVSPLERFDRLLVASDGSEFGDAAVREALVMARRFGAQLHAMTLVPTGVEHEGLGEAVLKQELQMAQDHLDQISVQAADLGVSCETYLVQGQNVDGEIVELAERLKADVIVMGRRGRHTLARLMLSNTTTQVIGQARCSVLVVPRRAHIEGRHLVLATDGSRGADAAAITAAQIAGLCEARTTVMSVLKPDYGAERRAEARQAVDAVLTHWQSLGLEADGVVLDGQPSEVIVAVARERAVDLIITGSHGRTGFERVLLGSTSERILNETECAVLVVKGR